MNRHLPKIICLFCIILSIFLCSFINNIKQQDEITFSKPSGFYNNEFYLKIKGNGDIYYTLDGSIPDKNSIKYTKPILITDASKNPNTISMRKDIRISCDSNEVPKNIPYCRWPYHPPDFLIDKCNIIRAVSISDNKISKVKSASYFVGFDKKEGYENINIVSIIVSPKDFFDDKDGIFVLGKNFDYNKITDFCEEEKYSPNFYRHGINYEKNAHVDFFDTDKKFISEKEAGIRIKGTSSRHFPHKSFNLYARKNNNNYSNFSNRIMQLNYNPGHMSLSGTGDDKQGIRNYLIQTLVKDKNFATMKHEPCAVFLNGEYWGLYWLTEKYNKQYISHYYGVDKNNIVIIKGGELDVGDEDDLKDYKKMYSFISNNDFSKKENYEKIKKLIDLDSFIQYFSVQLYIANRDFGTCDKGVLWKNENNIALWKTKIPDNFHDCKWRYMLFDLNAALYDYKLTLKDDKLNNINNDVFFKKLMSNKEIRHKFANEIIKLSLNEFNPAKTTKFIDDYDDTYRKAIEKHWNRYFGENNGVVDFRRIKEFFIKRPEIIYNEYCKQLDDNLETDKEVENVCKKYR